jgi:hypothetical protein
VRLAKWLEVLGRIKRRYCDDGTIGQASLPLATAYREGIQTGFLGIVPILDSA